MKKVMKKFNRALSIMLVAAMVLTMAPQTAMPVLAAEPEVEAQVVEPVADTTGDDAISEEGDVTPADDEESEDVTEEDSEDNPADSDEADDEQTGDVDDGDETPVTEKESTPEEETTTKTPEKVDDKTSDDTPDEGFVSGATTDKLQPVDFKVTAVEPDTSEGAEAGATVALTSAEIVYTNGCVARDGKLRKDADITFKLLPKAGRKLGTVQYKTKGVAEDAPESTGSATLDGDTYTIPKTALMHEVTKEDGTKETVNDVNVTIVVNSTEVEYTLKVVATDYKLYEIKDGKADTEKEITTAAAKKIKYSETDGISFALVKGDGAPAKLRGVTAKAGDSENEKTLESTTKTTDETPYDIYTVKPSELADIAENADQDITITVTAEELATITISTPVSDPAGAVTFGTVANKDALYDDVAVDVSGTAKEGQKVVFTAKAADKYTALTDADVTATFTPDGGTARTVTVTRVDETKKTVSDEEKTIPTHYVIDLANETKAGTLAIKATTTLDDTQDGVKKVDFSSVSENSVEITKTGSTDNLAGKTEKTAEETSYDFKAAAKPGYVIYKVEAVYDKEYKGQGDEGADLAAVSGYKENLYVAEDTLLENGAYVAAKGNLSSISVAFGGTDASDVADGQGHASKNWTTKNVVVNVYAKLASFADDKTVYITSEYPYEVKTGDNVILTDNDEYTVKSGADFFEFTVDAEAEPDVVAVYGDDNSILHGEPTKGEGTYTYQIAAAALADAQKITIDRQLFGITVTYDADTVSGEVNGQPFDNFDEEGTGTVTIANQEADNNYKFIIEPKDNAEIEKVSYTMGDSEEPVVVTSKTGVYAFSVKLTGNLDVTVETKDEYDLVVMEDGEAVAPDKKGVYNVGHASTVTAQLLKGTDAQALFNAEVKDGKEVAATIAKITGKAVTLEFDSSEYNKELTVELTLNDKKTKKSFKVKTTAVATEVSLTGVKGGKVDLPVDTKASYKLAVKTKNATLAGIGVKVVPADDEKKADATEIAKAQAAVSAVIDENDNLVITALPAMEGTANAAKVIIVDETGLEQADIDKLTVDNALKNGVVTVNTKNATIDGKNPTVSLVSTTDTKIKVKLGVPKGVVDPETGKIYYKVELTVPQEPTFPEGTSDAAKAAITAALTKAATDWNTGASAYQEKAVLDAKGGLLEIPVMVFADGVAAELKKGVLMNGFSVKATLLQTLAEDGNPATEATTIKGGETTLSNIATKNPYYEVKLGLKKGTTNLITGQNKDVVIATPVFNKLTSYSSVAVQFVNTSTGEILGSNTYSGLSARYDELQNAVIVNAAGAYYYNYNNYKNLGVKVTAYAEDSAYGAVATQKITVANGIQVINASAPYEIYKQSGKAASFTVSTDLNNMSTEKKYAPKSKKLKYEIESVNADLKANVTVKNGKVSINKKYVVKARENENQFRVKVIADDYASESPVVDYTETITITGSPMEMGTIAVFDVTGGTNAAKLVALNNGSLNATKKNNEFRVAVLKPGVKTSRKTYDLGAYSDDIMDSGLFTLKSSNAKSVEVAANGNLSVIKAAKNVKITATPKDGSKLNKALTTLTLKTVGQVDEAPVLRISRYKGSSESTETPYTVGETSINYSGNSTNNYFKLEVVKPVTTTVGDKTETTYVPFYLANYQISYKGAKQISKTVKSNGDEIKIVANAAETKITLKNKADKKATPIVYTLTNADCVTDKKAKAPKITTKAKLKQNSGYGYVSYSVKGQKGDDFTDDYVMLTVDQTKKNPDDIEDVLPELDKPLPIILGQSFNLLVDTYGAAGNYNLVATVGSLKDGEFKPLYKDAKVTVKIAKQGKATLSVTGNYTLSLKNDSGVYLKYKSGNGWINFTNVEYDEDDNYIDKSYAKNAIINGQENHFSDYFEVRKDYYGDIYIALKADLPLVAPEATPNVPSLDKIVSDAYKNDRIGYISVNNGEKYIDVKLNITLKDYTKDKTKYKVTATPVLEGPNAVTSLTILEGKNRVAAMGILAESTAGFNPVRDANGNVYLEAANLSAGKHKVDLYIVSAYAADAYLDAISKATGDAQKDLMRQYGVKTSITVTATAKATTKNKVVLVNKNSNKWNVADTDYIYTGWSKSTPFSFKSGLSVAANTNVIDVKATVGNKDVDYVSFEVANKTWMTSATENGRKVISLPASHDMTIKLDKAKLVAAIAKDAADDTIAKKNKLDWGKTVKVKATFSYGTDGPVADELTFDVKLPANAGAADADVTKALTDAQDTLQSNIETLYKDLLDQYGAYSDWNIITVNTLMKSYIETEVKKAIKGAAVTVAITDNGSYDVVNDSVALADAWTVVVTSNATGNAELYNNIFAIPTQNEVDAIESAIGDLTLQGGADSDEIQNAKGERILKVTASTTPAEFAKAVREALGAKATRNISITAVIDGETKNPSLTKKGSIAFKLTIKDLSKKPSDYDYSTEMRPISYELPKLDDLAGCKNKVSTGLTDAVLSAIVKDAWKAVHTSDDAFKAEVQKQVGAKANELIDNNPAIKVSGIVADTFELNAPTSSTTAGTISFTLQLTEDGKTAEDLADAAYKLEITSKTLEASEEFQSPAELLAAAKTITEIDYAADENAALDAIKAKVIALSKNPGYNTGNIAVEKTPAVEGEDGTVFTAPGENAGTITKVIVKVGTTDADKDTIASVSIKKQATPTT